ncbi:hypothetical protein Hdeb2414_s0093g00789401 [Helianthus debilis subsp. tardiflorus]
MTCNCIFLEIGVLQVIVLNTSLEEYSKDQSQPFKNLFTWDVLRHSLKWMTILKMLKQISNLQRKKSKTPDNTTSGSDACCFVDLNGSID